MNKEIVEIRLWQEWPDEWCAGFGAIRGYGKTKIEAIINLANYLEEPDLTRTHYVETYVMEAFEKRVNEIRDTLGFLCTYDGPVKLMEAINKMGVRINE